jgi:hypothetical protein
MYNHQYIRLTFGGNMLLEPEQIKENWDNLLNFIEDNFTGERQEGLLKMYHYFEDRIALMPASNRTYFHSCFPGGYVHHVQNVIEFAQRMDELWICIGGKRDYTTEELLFVALNHDLGKVGDEHNEYYTSVEESWKIQRGELYNTMSNKLNYMKSDHRSLYLLQSFGIKMTQLEYLGISLHEWLYDDGNKPYIINYFPEMKLKTNLPMIIHFADMFAARKEYEEWLDDQANAGKKIESAKKKIQQTLRKKDKLSDIGKLNEEASKSVAGTFNDVFGEMMKSLEKNKGDSK